MNLGMSAVPTVAPSRRSFLIAISRQKDYCKVTMGERDAQWRGA
jgi:hypothetical protein